MALSNSHTRPVFPLLSSQGQVLEDWGQLLHPKLELTVCPALPGPSLGNPNKGSGLEHSLTCPQPPDHPDVFPVLLCGLAHPLLAGNK